MLPENSPGTGRYAVQSSFQDAAKRRRERRDFGIYEISLY
jgi:hypothetical protein